MVFRARLLILRAVRRQTGGARQFTGQSIIVYQRKRDCTAKKRFCISDIGCSKKGKMVRSNIYTMSSGPATLTDRLTDTASTERWSGCDNCRRYMHQDSRETRSEVNVSFAGCGFLGIYHLGVLRCFLTHGKPMLHRVKRWSGASAGALAAASIICIPNKLDEALGLMNTLIDDIQGKPLGPLTPGYNMMDRLRTELEKILPPNAHKLASGKLFLSATCITDRRNSLLSEFDTREELIQALLCSCYIPVYGGYRIPTYRGKKYIDGGLSSNMPTFSTGTTVCISPFSGPLQQICPDDNPTYENFYGVVFGHSFQINTQNIVRGFQALFPPNQDILEGYNRQGWNDALDFLQENGYTADSEVDSDMELD